MKQPELYVCSACCTWHGPISETAMRVIPVCPHCGSPLMQYDDQATWDQKIGEFCDKQGWKPGSPEETLYRGWMQSLHDSGTCVPLKGWDWRRAMNEWGAAHA